MIAFAGVVVTVVVGVVFMASMLLMEADELEVLLEAENEEQDSMLLGAPLRCLVLVVDSAPVVTMIVGLAVLLITGWWLR